VPPCSPFKQVLLIFGLLTSSAVQAAAPLCSEVLRVSQNASFKMSPELVEQTLQQLAELKLQVDTATVTDEQSTFESLRETEFKKKLTLITEQLRGIMTPEQIHERLSSHIHELQKRETQKDVTENVVRAEEREITKGYIWERQIDTMTDGLATTLKYLPNENSLVLRDSKNGNLRLLNLTTNQSTVIARQMATYFVLNSGTSLLTLSTHGRLAELNLKTGDSRPLDGVQVETHSLQDVSPNEKLYVTASNADHRLMFIDIATGHYSAKQPKLPEPQRAISAVKFLNDNEVLVTRFMDNFIYKVNIQTGATEKIDTGAHAINNIYVSPKSDRIILTAQKGVITLETKDITQIANLPLQEVGKSVSSIQFLEEGKRTLLVYRNDSQQRGIFGTEHFTDAIYNFPESLNKVEPQIITQPAYDAKSKSFFFPGAYKNPDGIKEYHIEIWKQEP